MTVCVLHVGRAVFEAGTSGILGYLGARWFTAINPMHGGFFGVIYALVNRVVEPFFKAIFERRGAGDELKCLGLVLHVATNIGISLSVCAAFGIQLTLQSACVLIVIQTAIPLLGLCALVCGAACCCLPGVLRLNN